MQLVVDRLRAGAPPPPSLLRSVLKLAMVGTLFIPRSRSLLVSDLCLSVALHCNPMVGVCPEAASVPGISRGARAPDSLQGGRV
jgi:hypothetical protein